jgi:hypothetical protein
MQNHPLEHNAAERAYFSQTAGDYRTCRAAYRRAVEALTGSLPTWAERAKRGPKPKAQNATKEAN